MSNAELGFGLMRFRGSMSEKTCNQIRDVLDEYMCGDFCYFDLHPSYCDGHAQRIFKQYIARRYARSSYYLANKMPYFGLKIYQDYEDTLDEELQECGVEYFDYYMLHCITNDIFQMHEKLGGFTFLRECKERGSAGKVGISFHGSPELLNQILEKYEFIEFVQLQINFVDWESAVIRAHECYEIASKYKKQIIVMEPIKGGTLACNFEIETKRYTAEKLADISLRFVSNIPNISIILSGMTEIEHVRRNRLSVNKEELPQEEYTIIKKKIEGNKKIPCTNCHYCKRECKQNIDIPGIISCVNESYKSAGDGLTRRWFARLFYLGNISEEQRASKCLECGACENKCPQHIAIRKIMKEAKELFEIEIEQQTVETRKDIIHLKNIFSSHSISLFGNIEKSKVYKIYPYGAGGCFKHNVQILEKYGSVQSVIDGDDTKTGEEIIPGIRCINLNDLDTKSSFIVIMVEKVEFAKQIEVNIQNAGIQNYDIFWNWKDYAQNLKWEK